MSADCKDENLLLSIIVALQSQRLSGLLAALPAVRLQNVDTFQSLTSV